MSVYVSLNSSRSIGEGINGNLFHCFWQISELDSLLPLIPELLLLLLLCCCHSAFLCCCRRRRMIDGAQSIRAWCRHTDYKTEYADHRCPLRAPGSQLCSSLFRLLPQPLHSQLPSSPHHRLVILQGPAFRRPSLEPQCPDNIYCSSL